MGANYSSSGIFTVSPPLTEEHAAYLHRFHQTRRMKRDSKLLAATPDPTRVAVGLPVGKQGGYFVGASSDDSSYREPSVIDSSKPPTGQPGLWCPWVPTEDRSGIQHKDGNHSQAKWLRYIIEHFLRPWGYTVDGTVFLEGEYDKGRVTAYKNFVKSRMRQKR